jgi:hypothetical protein
VRLRLILVALLAAGPAWAADDNEAPPRMTPKQQEQQALLPRAAKEALAGKILWPNGLVLTVAGFTLFVMHMTGVAGFHQENRPNCPDGCYVENDPGGAMGIAGATMLAVGFVAFAAGVVCSLAARTHRAQFDPLMASVRF